MLEMVFVYGVSDAEAVKQASAKFFAIASEALTKLQAILPAVVPPIELLPPESREFAEGTIYFYKLPEEWGLDPQIAPSAGLSKNVLTLSLFLKTSLRLLKPTPLQAEGPLAARNQPLTSASYFNWAGLLEAVTPWIDYSADNAAPFLAAVPEDAPAPGSSTAEFKAGTRIVLDFLKCLRTMSSVSYVEGKALVTHSEWHIVDQK